MLGQLVEKLDGRPWAESLRRRGCCGPLEMRRTTVGFDDGDHVDRLLRAAVPRRAPARAGARTCGRWPLSAGLASTARDLARWSAFVAVPDPRVLSPDTLEEMCQPQVLLDPERWTGGDGPRLLPGPVGLGAHVGRPRRRDARPHHRAVHPPRERHRRHRADEQHRRPPTPRRSPSSWPTTWSSTTRRGRALAAGRLACPRSWPASSAAGSPRAAASSSRCARAGWRPGMDGAPADRAPSVFEAEGADRYRTESGRERGELLRVTRDADGAVDRLHWATYLFTREPLGVRRAPTTRCAQALTTSTRTRRRVADRLVEHGPPRVRHRQPRLDDGQPSAAAGRRAPRRRPRGRRR